MTSRRHGPPPYRVAVLHGGPGAPGSAGPLARELARDRGVLECLQSARSVDGQVAELHDDLLAHAEPPVALVGHSWGAWLGVLLAERHPEVVRKLVLVGSGPFEASYAEQIMPRRLARLSERQAVEATALLSTLEDPDAPERDNAPARLGALLGRADAYDPLPPDLSDEVSQSAPPPFQPDVYASVWREASELRRSGELLRLAGEVRCPVVAIHGDHDPHPAEGVEVPLSQVLRDFRMVLLDRCGHEPWTERWAREGFFEVLRRELGSPDL